jgi:hypothetical protein
VPDRGLTARLTVAAGLAQALGLAAMAALGESNAERADATYEEAIDVARAEGERVALAFVLDLRVLFVMARSDLGRAAASL